MRKNKGNLNYQDLVVQINNIGAEAGVHVGMDING